MNTELEAARRRRESFSDFSLALPVYLHILVEISVKVGAVLSLTSEYVLRAMIYLAQHEQDCPVPGRTIALEACIPAKYLSNVLGALVRNGILESSPGRTGGFSMARSADRIKLFDLLAPFESFHIARCPFGNQACSDDHPCVAHSRWKKVKEAELAFLSDTSVKDVAFEASGSSKKGKRKK